jgi:leucyl aminopeptidase
MIQEETKMEIKITNKKIDETIINLSFETKNQFFKGKENEIYETKENKKTIINLGLGKKEDYSSLILRSAISKIIRYLQKRPYQKCVVELNKEFYINDINNTIKIIIETAILASHKNNLMKTKEKENIEFKTLFIFSNEKIDQNLIKKSEVISKNVNWAKDLVNLPSNVVTPVYFVNETKNKIKNVKFTIYGRKEIIKQKLNLVEAVSRSSNHEPQFMIIEYKPKTYTNKNPICLIGKGITFDTGGVSLKPSSFPGNFIRNMKCDMAGAATVVSVMKSLTELKSNKWIISITPLCENTLGGNSYKVDDVIISHSGLSVEIVNTDAEGRLVLADALSFAKKFKPQSIINVATLTGASLIALGDRGACYMSNDNNLSSILENASNSTDEKIWRLPLWKEYEELLKSDIADLLNLNEAKGPGTIVGGMFLKNFVDEKTPWAHFDIGASAFVEKDLPLSKKGATGICIRLLCEAVNDL